MFIHTVAQLLKVHLQVDQNLCFSCRAGFACLVCKCSFELSNMSNAANCQKTLSGSDQLRPILLNSSQ